MYYAGFVVILVKKNMIEIDKHYSLIHHVQVLFKLSKWPLTDLSGQTKISSSGPTQDGPG